MHTKKVLRIYLVAAYTIFFFMCFYCFKSFLDNTMELYSVRADHFFRSICPAQRKATGLPFLFIRSDPCSRDSDLKFLKVLKLASLHSRAEIYVIDLCGRISDIFNDTSIVFLNGANKELHCFFPPLKTYTNFLTHISSNLSVARWFYLKYFAQLYQAPTLLYIGSDTVVLEDPLHLLPTTAECASLSSMFVMSEHLALVQQPFLDCVTQGVMLDYLGQSLLPGAPRAVGLDVDDHLRRCERLFLAAAPAACRADPAAPFARTLARDHSLRSSQGLAMWREGPGSGPQEFKRLAVRRGAAFGADNATGRPVQLASLHFQVCRRAPPPPLPEPAKCAVPAATVTGAIRVPIPTRIKPPTRSSSPASRQK